MTRCWQRLCCFDEGLETYELVTVVRMVVRAAGRGDRVVLCVETAIRAANWRFGIARCAVVVKTKLDVGVDQGPNVGDVVGVVVDGGKCGQRVDHESKGGLLVKCLPSGDLT